MPRNIDPARLVNCIRRIPHAESVETRDRYVRVLRALTGDTGGPPRVDAVLEDLAQIVMWCQRRPNGLGLLVEAIRSVEGDIPEVEPLHNLVRLGEPTEHLSAGERRYVAEVMSSLDRSAVWLSLTDALGKLSERLRGTDFNAEMALRLLEDAIPGANEPHPLIPFLAVLAGMVPEEHREELGNLVNVVADRTHGRVWDADLATAEPTPQQYYLVVRIAEDQLRALIYWVHFWLVTEDGHWSLRYTAERPHLLEEVQTKLNELLLELAEDPRVAIVDLSIEFILPRTMLNLDVEMWESTALGEGQSSRIGVEYPVVVRDLRRMRNRLLRERWRRRCQVLQQHRAGASRGMVRIIPFAKDDEHDDYVDLLRDPDRPICLVPSGQHAVGRVTTRLDGWLNAGVPVVVWCRDQRASARFDANLPELLIEGGVLQLPRGVQQLRQDASGLGFPPAHVGMHITLLWDEERRRPPDDHPLQKPSVDMERGRT
jgi:hypothetical protein